VIGNTSVAKVLGIGKAAQFPTRQKSIQVIQSLARDRIGGRYLVGSASGLGHLINNHPSARGSLIQ
jgi:hypothetical protein